MPTHRWIRTERCNDTHRQADAHSHTHTNTRSGHSLSSPHFPGQPPHGEALGKENNVRAAGEGKEAGNLSASQAARAVLGMGGSEGVLGPGSPVCWALPVAPKLREWQGGGHCHILSASGSRQAWLRLGRKGRAACSFQESQACRSGAGQAPPRPLMASRHPR